MHDETARLHRRRRVVVFWVLIALVSAAGASEDALGMGVTFATRSVMVAGAARGHDIIVFGISIGSHGGAAILRREVKTAADDDGDGKITFSVRDVPERSVWIVVDAQSGEYVIATPSGVAPRPLSVPAAAWRESRPHVDVPGSYVEILVVRPGGGAWTLRSADGGPNDSDGLSDRKMRLRLDKMEKLLGDQKGPPHAIARDVVVMVDPQTLDTFVSEAK